MTSTPDTMNFLQKIGKDADGYANGLALTMIVFVLATVIWTGLHALGIAGETPKVVQGFALWFFVGWMIFQGVCAIIDYTLFALSKTYAFLAVATLNELNGKVDPLFAEPGEPQPPAPVSYLQDFLSRSRVRRRPENDEKPFA